MTITLYHGGHTRIEAPGSRGLFVTADRRVAESHGPVVSEFEVSESDLLTHYKLNYEIEDMDTIRDVLERELPAGADIDCAWEIVIASAGCDGAEDDPELFGVADAAEAGWEAQRIRGRVALALGYRAVEMRDEHGTSWLLVRTGLETITVRTPDGQRHTVRRSNTPGFDVLEHVVNWLRDEERR